MAAADMDYDYIERSSRKRSGSADSNDSKRRRSRKGLNKQFECDEPGCEKSFTRLEHLYRHQLNRKWGAAVKMGKMGSAPGRLQRGQARTVGWVVGCVGDNDVGIGVTIGDALILCLLDIFFFFDVVSIF